MTLEAFVVAGMYEIKFIIGRELNTHLPSTIACLLHVIYVFGKCMECSLDTARPSQNCTLCEGGHAVSKLHSVYSNVKFGDLIKLHINRLLV